MCAERDHEARRPEPGADLERLRTEVQARIARHVDEHGTRHAFGSYVDPASHRLVVETDAPGQVVDGLLADVRGSASVVVRRTRITDT